MKALTTKKSEKKNLSSLKFNLFIQDRDKKGQKTEK